MAKKSGAKRTFRKSLKKKTISKFSQFQKSTNSMVMYKNINPNFVKKVLTAVNNVNLTTSGPIFSAYSSNEIPIWNSIVTTPAWQDLVVPTGASNIKAVYQTVSCFAIRVTYIPIPLGAQLTSVAPGNSNTPISYFQMGLFPDYLTGATNTYSIQSSDDKKVFQQNLTIPQSVYWRVPKQWINSTSNYPAFSNNPLDTIQVNANYANYPGIIAISNSAQSSGPTFSIGQVVIDFYCTLANMG